MSKIAFSSVGLWALGVLALSLSNGCVHVEREIHLPGDGISRWGPDHDRTTPKALEIVSARPDAKGIGVFLVPAPHIGPLEYRVTIAPCLTYAQTARRGFNCEAFEFLPEECITLKDFAVMASGCGGRSCSQFQKATDCTPGCSCKNGYCIPMLARDLARLSEQVGEECPDIYGPRINPTTP